MGHLIQLQQGLRALVVQTQFLLRALALADIPEDPLDEQLPLVRKCHPGGFDIDDIALEGHHPVFPWRYASGGAIARLVLTEGHPEDPCDALSRQRPVFRVHQVEIGPADEVVGRCCGQKAHGCLVDHGDDAGAVAYEDRVGGGIKKGAILLSRIGQQFFGFLARIDVDVGPFVVENPALLVPDGAGADGDPERASVFAACLVFEIFNHTPFAYQPPKNLAVLSANVMLTADILDIRDHFGGRGISAHFGKSLVDTDEPAFRGALKKALHGVLENGAILLRCSFAFGKVARNRKNDVFILYPQKPRGHPADADPPVLSTKPGLQVLHVARCHQPADQALPVRGVVP